MQVFRLFVKIIKKNLFLVCIYLGIFALITSFLISSIKTDTTYEDQKVTAFIEVEEDSQEIQYFLDFLKPYIIEKKLDSAKDVDDALFWDDIDLYLYVPKDYYSKVLSNEEAITIKSSPDSIASYSLVSKINSYFNQVRENIRLDICGEEHPLIFTKERIVSSEDISVDIQNKASSNSIAAMFNTGVYIICSLTLLVVGLISFEMRTTDIQRRLNISPLSIAKRNGLLTICYAVFSVLFVGIVTLIGYIIFKEELLPRMGYYILNSCLFSLVMICMALLMSSLFKSDTAFNCVTVIFPLATAFICGCFVDLSIMPEFTKVIAHIFPNYYIVLGNSYINTCGSFSFAEYLRIIWPCFLFIVIFIGLTIFITKKMAKSEN